MSFLLMYLWKLVTSSFILDCKVKREVACPFLSNPDHLAVLQFFPFHSNPDHLAVLQFLP